MFTIFTTLVSTKPCTDRCSPF